MSSKYRCAERRGAIDFDPSPLSHATSSEHIENVIAVNLMGRPPLVLETLYVGGNNRLD